MRQGNNNRRGRQPKQQKQGTIPTRNQVFDSNGPDVRVRGNAHQVYDKYSALAREATAAGNHVQAEAHLQFAEHYLRLHLAATVMGGGNRRGGNGSGPVPTRGTGRSADFPPGYAGAPKNGMSNKPAKRVTAPKPAANAVSAVIGTASAGIVMKKAIAMTAVSAANASHAISKQLNRAVVTMARLIRPNRISQKFHCSTLVWKPLRAKPSWKAVRQSLSLLRLQWMKQTISSAKPLPL